MSNRPIYEFVDNALLAPLSSVMNHIEADITSIELMYYVYDGCLHYISLLYVWSFQADLR